MNVYLERHAAHVFRGRVSLRCVIRALRQRSHNWNQTKCLRWTAKLSRVLSQNRKLLKFVINNRRDWRRNSRSVLAISKVALSKFTAGPSSRHVSSMSPGCSSAEGPRYMYRWWEITVTWARDNGGDTRDDFSKFHTNAFDRIRGWHLIEATACGEMPKLRKRQKFAHCWLSLLYHARYTFLNFFNYNEFRRF